MNNKGEPPSTPTSNVFRIGRDSGGHWIVQDDKGLCGGLFIDRAAALKFAMFENGNQPQAVVMMPGVFELNLNGPGSGVTCNENHYLAEQSVRRAA